MTVVHLYLRKPDATRAKNERRAQIMRAAIKAAALPAKVVKTKRAVRK